MSDVGSVDEWAAVARQQETGEGDACVPRFYMREVQNKIKSEEQGRPIFDMREWVEIFIPGEKHNRPDRKVTDEDKARWPQAYKRFTESSKEVMDGTPLEHWPFLNRAQVAEFKAIGIMTVESLAGMADGMIDKLGPGGRDIVKRAQQHLQPADEIETELRAENRELKQKLEELTARIGAMESQPKRRGRPPKVRNDTQDDMSERAEGDFGV